MASVVVERVKVNAERCKGCELCIPVCPKDVLAVSKHFNKHGLLTVEVIKPEACISCQLCAVMCPDMAIDVWKP